jgi:alpha-L-fucosidase
VDRKIKAALQKQSRAETKGVIPELPPHCDFRTPEYTGFDTIQAKKWEATRGMSHSFGFNRADTETDYESVESLVHSFIATVAKNGNLLLNVGPRADDAQIPEPQFARLRAFGAWLQSNGTAIYGTRPWSRAEGKTSDGSRVCFTARGKTLYAHVLAPLRSSELVIEGSDLPNAAHAIHVASGAEVPCARTEGGLRLALPEALAAAPAHAFALTG